jgi:hypothetical protein
MTLAIPAVNVIEKAKLLGTFGKVYSGREEAAPGPLSITMRRKKGLRHRGIGASPGIAIIGSFPNVFIIGLGKLFRISVNDELNYSSGVDGNTGRIRIIFIYRYDSC